MLQVPSPCGFGGRGSAPTVTGCQLVYPDLSHEDYYWPTGEASPGDVMWKAKSRKSDNEKIGKIS